MSDREKLDRMMLYAQTALCRWQILSKYFAGESEQTEECKTCDNCARPLAQRLDVEIPAVKPTRAEEAKILEKLRAENSAPEIEVGDLVELPKTGKVEVAKISDDKVEVILPDGERKTFKTQYVRKKNKPRNS
jgi:superfamily II DNA helicase RecQ